MIYKVLVPSDDGYIHKFDAIEWQGGLWIVPQWLEQPAAKLQKPMRIIRVDHLGREALSGNQGADFHLKGPVPSALFDLRVQPSPDSGFEVRDLPAILLNDDGSPSDKGVIIRLDRQ